MRKEIENSDSGYLIVALQSRVRIRGQCSERVTVPREKSKQATAAI